MTTPSKRLRSPAARSLEGGARWPQRFLAPAVFAVAIFVAGVVLPATAAPAAVVLEVRKIWDEAPHNAFTDLLRWRERWWCVFREGEAHVGGDGAVRVLTSADGRAWALAARITEKDTDLRDPKLSLTPDNRLMIVCGGSVYLGTKELKGRRSRVMFSRDGRAWTRPQRVLGEGEWLWRVTWHEGIAYGAAYAEADSGPPSAIPGERVLRLYRSRDAIGWELVTPLTIPGRPGETTLRFDASSGMTAVVRREGEDRMGWVGRSAPPYRDWRWQVGDRRLGGPNLVALPDRSWVIGTREYARPDSGSAQGAKMILTALDEKGRTTPLITLPSGGDCSYPGMVWHDGELWVSYYSSHEGKTAIYLARVQVTVR